MFPPFQLPPVNVGRLEPWIRKRERRSVRLEIPTFDVPSMFSPAPVPNGGPSFESSMAESATDTASSVVVSIVSALAA